MEIISQSAKETREIGKILAQETLKTKAKRAVIVALKGELGSGKTTFVQGFAQGLKLKEKITSPSFIIFKKYKLSGKVFYHVDCYRLSKVKDLKDLGLEEIMKNPENIVLIEWGERVKKLLPSKTLWIKFIYQKKNQRKLCFKL